MAKAWEKKYRRKLANMWANHPLVHTCQEHLVRQLDEEQRIHLIELIDGLNAMWGEFAEDCFRSTPQ